MSSLKFVVKTVFNNEFRRFVLREPSFDLLVRTISQSYENLKPGFSIKYPDDEGDLCLISSDVELVEAFDVAGQQKKALKLTIEGKVQDEAQLKAPSSPPVSPLAEPLESKAPVAEVEDEDEDEDERQDAEAKDEGKTACPALDEIIPLLISLLKDVSVQKALPQVLTTALASLSRQDVSIQQVVNEALASAPEVQRHPAIQKLLPLLPQVSHLFEAAIARVRQVLPFVMVVASQFIQRLPQLLATVDLDSWGECLRQKLRRGHCRRMGMGMCRMFGPMFGGRSGGACSMFGGCPTRGADQVCDQKQSGQVHSNITCDGCGQFPLVGVRYKCTVCPDFDLCAPCEAKNQHPADHTFLKLKEAPRSDVHQNIRCDGCGVAPITGIRFKCTVCHDFDLCQGCEAKNIHDADHPLLKLKTPRRGGDGPCARGPFGGRRRFCPRGGSPHPHGPHHGSHHGPHHGPHGPHPHPAMHPMAHLMQSVHQAWQRHSAEGKAEAAVPAKKVDGKQELKEFKSKFVRDLNYPDGCEVSAGQTLVKEWEFVNPEGAPRWPEGVKLVFQRGDRELLGAEEEFAISPAAPGERVTLAVALPLSEQLVGKKRAYFRLADANRTEFGDRCWVDLDIKSVPERKEAVKESAPQSPSPVVVSAPAPAPAAVPAPVSPPVSAPAAPVAAVASVEKSEVKPSQPQVQADDLSVPQKYKPAMALLHGMGFTSRDVNLYLLEKANGDLQRVVSWLLELRKSA